MTLEKTTFRFDKIDELFKKTLNYVCELIGSSNASLLEITIAITYMSKALLKIVALSGEEMAKVTETIEEMLVLNEAAVLEVINFIKENTKEKENEQS
jgi:hypothetical protein